MRVCESMTGPRSTVAPDFAAGFLRHAPTARKQRTMAVARAVANMAQLPYPNGSVAHTDHLLARSWARLVTWQPKATLPQPKTRFSAARKGDRVALGDLLERHQRQVFAFGMKMCGDPDDAQEVAQDTLLSMVRSVARFPGRGFAFDVALHRRTQLLHQETTAHQGSARAPRAARCGRSRAGCWAGAQPGTDTARAPNGLKAQ